MENAKSTRAGRVEVILPPGELAEVDRRAAEELLPRTAYFRRLAAADARQHPAGKADLRAVA